MGSDAHSTTLSMGRCYRLAHKPSSRHRWKIPRLWKAPTTSSCHRKHGLRLLIGDITVVNNPEPKLLHLQVRRQGGATDIIEVHRRPKRAEAIRYSDIFVAKIQAMVEKCDIKRSLPSSSAKR
jgi:hypothetical protein